MNGAKKTICRSISEIKEKIEYHKSQEKRYNALMEMRPNDKDFRIEMLRHAFASHALEWVLVTKNEVQHSIDTNIENITMSAQLYNGLKRAGINKFSEMRDIKMKQFLSIRGFGKKYWQEMQDIINR